jgi:CheY-like chemotaxis protein
MKKIFLVDDDPILLRVYKQKLASGGFDVHTAADGLEAVRTLSTGNPDLVILDLMMPKLSGVDVLKFIRSHPKIAKVPVIVMTNAFMSDQARTVNTLGVARAIVKGDCTPALMLEIICQILGVESSPPGDVESEPETPAIADEATVPEAALAMSPEDILESTRATLSALRAAHQEFFRDDTPAGRAHHLHQLYKQVHHLTSNAALAQCHQVSLLGGAFEAMTYELLDKPQFINPSTIRTIASAVDMLAVLMEDARQTQNPEPLTAQVLIVDDDPLALRIAQVAMGRAKLNSRSTERPLEALDMMSTAQYDLILLDVEMPQMTGFDLCRKLRGIPGYETIPVIYVTSHSHFESRAKSILAGGNDLIAKPVFPIELAVKSVLHILKHRRGTIGLPAEPVA